ncbi:MAG: hypothetical protein ACOZBH_02720 [Patescibacteria group bacterium]
MNKSNKFNLINTLVILLFTLLLGYPFAVFGINDISFSSNTNLEVNTIDASPTLATVIAQNGSLATNIDIQSNYIDITLDAGSSIAFSTSSSSQYLKITKQSGSNAYTTSPACITNSVTMNGTGATVVLRLEVTSINPGCGGGGGGGGGVFTPQYPYNTAIVINNNAAETNSRTVSLSLIASNVNQMMISNDQSFTGAQWEAYQSGKSWTLTENFGTKIVYAKFKNSSGATSGAISDTINYVDKNIPPAECTLNCEKISYDLYIINPDGTERHSNSSFVRKETLDENTYLYKFEDKGADMDFDDIWIIAEQNDCQNIKFTVFKVNGRWTHQIKVKLLYQGMAKETISLWENSQLAVEQSKTVTLTNYSSVCETNIPVIPCVIDCDLLSYDLYIVNPDGTERHINTPYALTESSADGSMTYQFEDKGNDMDHDDVWIKVEKYGCSSINFSVVKLDAGWHHQIKVGLLYGGIKKEDILLWSDSQTALKQIKTLYIADYPEMCATDVNLNPGDIFKGSLDTVYYYGEDQKRHVFPSRNTYMTWYPDFSNVKTIGDSLLATIRLDGNVTYRPGVRMVKIISIPNVYAVDSHGVLRWIETEEVAQALYGNDWAKLVDDMPDSYFFNYNLGDPITSKDDFNPALATLKAIDISQDLLLTQ